MKREKTGRRTFLCREPGGSNLKDETFTIEANSMEEAREQASMWGAVVIREMRPIATKTNTGL